MANKKETVVESKKATKKTTKTASKAVEVKKPAKEVKVVEEPMANIMEETKETTSVSRDTLKLIGNVIFWTVFAVLACIWLVDYFRVKSEKAPMFCLNEKTHEYEDGTVKECTGLGYKIYTYNRQSLGKGIEFGPFFIKMKNSENN